LTKVGFKSGSVDVVTNNFRGIGKAIALWDEFAVSFGLASLGGSTPGGVRKAEASPSNLSSV
jgi:hypothetical protein